MSHLGPPPRWLKCPRKGNLIADKFLPFKTPLDSSYDETVPVQYRFSPSMLISLLQSNNIKMGLWIDLTNTTRFYDKSVIEKSGISYVKIQCRGHGACPSPEQTTGFIKICQNYINANPKNIIGVHCTHGFNRTGFLICAYLTEVYDWSIDAALNAFSINRPPGIYKGHYITELFTRYGDVDDAPQEPVLPEWCFDDNESNFNNFNDNGDENNGEEHGSTSSSVNGERGQKRKREIIKKNAVFMEGISGVETVTSLAKISEIQRKCQDMCNWHGAGFPGSQPVSLDRYNIKFLAEKPYKVSWKADGTRYMMLINGDDGVYFIDRDNSVFRTDEIQFPRRKAPNELITDTLVDGEMIIDIVKGENYPKFLIYDIVKFENIDVGGTDFERRILCIDKEIIGPREQAKKEGRIDSSRCPFSVRKKEFWDLSITRSLLGEKFTKNLGHEVDGLIFQPIPDKYKAGRCLEVLKWKPHTHNSIDFKLQIVSQEKLGMLRETIGYLWVNKWEQPFGQIKVTRELRQYDKKIIECTWDYEKRVWKFMRERVDKSFPNAYDTAVSVWNTIQNPITSEILFNFIEHNRYARRHDQTHSHSSSSSSSSNGLINKNDKQLMPPPAKIPRR